VIIEKSSSGYGGGGGGGRGERKPRGKFGRDGVVAIARRTEGALVSLVCAKTRENGRRRRLFAAIGG
jgi:hypothetical protein